MGHGSHLSPESSAPVYQHAATLRSLGDFDEVVEAFWKEEPSLPHALDLMSSDEIWIVPIFLAEGYFTRQVVPRELGLTGQLARPRTSRIHYCAPVGTHPLMADMVLRRAITTSKLPLERRRQAALLIIGHGTERSATSGDTVYRLVDQLREHGEFGSVGCGFLDEEPNIARVLDEVEADDVVLVPFFIADGWHTATTIPKDLALEGTVTRRAGRTIWYTPPIGTLSDIAEVVRALTRSDSQLIAGEAGGAAAVAGAGGEGSRAGSTACGVSLDAASGVEAPKGSIDSGNPRGAGGGPAAAPESGGADRRRQGSDFHEIRTPDANFPPALSTSDSGSTNIHVVGSGGAGSSTDRSALPTTDRAAFFDWVGDSIEGRLFLEIRVRRTGEDIWELRHRDDLGVPENELTRSADPEEALEIARYTASGEYRPLRTAATLRRGWTLTLSGEDTWRAISLLYPATVVYWNRPELAEEASHSYQEWAERQSGIYSSLRQLLPQLLPAVVQACCISLHCQRTRLWRHDDVFPVGDFATRGGSNGVASSPLIPCPEPCTLFGSIARETLYANTTCEEPEDVTP